MTFAVSGLTVRAELARHGLLPNQLAPYWNPDTERTETFLETPEGRRSAVAFLCWLEAQTHAQKAGSAT